MNIEVKNEEVIVHYLEEEYVFTLDELRSFKVDIEWIPTDGFRPSYYWVVSTSSDPIYQTMSALVFSDLEEAIRWKSRRNQERIAVI